MHSGVSNRALRGADEVKSMTRIAFNIYFVNAVCLSMDLSPEMVSIVLPSPLIIKYLLVVPDLWSMGSHRPSFPEAEGLKKVKSRALIKLFSLHSVNTMTSMKNERFKRVKLTFS